MIPIFRVWNGREMFYLDKIYGIELTFNKTGGWCLWYTWVYPNEIIGGIGYAPEMQLMLSSQINDKNNVEIYEDDIVIGKKFGKGIIKFKDGCFGIKTKYAFLSFPVCSDIEVIGNIYENPELIED